MSQIKEEKKTDKGKRKTVFESFDMIKKQLDPNRDRNHAITEQIDAIRAEQIQRARLKKEHRKLRLTEKHKVISWHCIKTFNIRPRSTWKQIWDIAILLLVVFSSVQIPLLLAFPDMTPLDQALQITLDAIFIVDFGFCFKTGKCWLWLLWCAVIAVIAFVFLGLGNELLNDCFFFLSVPFFVSISIARFYSTRQRSGIGPRQNPFPLFKIMVCH